MNKSNDLLLQIRMKHQKISQEEFIFMSMFNGISCGTKDNEARMSGDTLKSYLCMQGRFGTRTMVVHWSRF